LKIIAASLEVPVIEKILTRSPLRPSDETVAFHTKRHRAAAAGARRLLLPSVAGTVANKPDAVS
jgi:hypothetical protein